MHEESLQWALSQIPEADGMDVIEVGGMDVNGNIRYLFTNTKSYQCVDIAAGVGVDIVAPFEHWSFAQQPEMFDLVVSLEVLEHAEGWKQMIQGAHRVLRPGGKFIGTCATINRAPHSAWGANEPLPGEHYANVSPQDLSTELLAFSDWTIRVTRRSMDIQWAAVK
jgi:SAM-dependent methyltransferase